MHKIWISPKLDFLINKDLLRYIMVAAYSGEHLCPMGATR